MSHSCPGPGTVYMDIPHCSKDGLANQADIIFLAPHFHPGTQELPIRIDYIAHDLSRVLQK